MLLNGPEPEDWIRGALEFVPRGRLPILREYLTQLIDGPYSDAELQALYRSTYTEVGVRGDSGVRVFLKMTRDIIDRQLAV